MGRLAERYEVDNGESRPGPSLRLNRQAFAPGRVPAVLCEASTMTDQVGTPSPVPPPGEPPRPTVLTVASVLWIVLGAMFALAGIWYLGTPEGMTSSTGPWAPLLLSLVGVAIVFFGIRLMRGSGGARTVLTVLGCLLLIGIWTVLLVVPALILQYQRSSSAWLQAVRRPG